MAINLKRMLVIAGLLLLGCGDDIRDNQASDAGPDVPPDAGQVQAACLDRPTDLPRPPNDSLPCELFPPNR